MKRSLIALLATPALIAAVPPQPTERQAWFGDLHLHTALSFDAYAWMGTRIMPEETYRFARGDAIDYFGQTIRRNRPLDFLAITDHSENVGVFTNLEDPDSAISQNEVGQALKAGTRDAFFRAMGLLRDGAKLPPNSATVAATAWARLIKAANDHYVPGRFTTFIGYEWSVNPDNQNLHRNIVFRGSTAPVPFTRDDSQKPEDLWRWLGTIRKQGFEALAIPHNGNVSNGLMWAMTQSDGSLITADWSRLRTENEPIAEIVQNKGTSETHPLLSPNDEFADFELYDWLLAGKAIKGKQPGSFWRDALGRGLLIAQSSGVNPYRIGAAGAGDLHTGLPVERETDLGGMGRIHAGGAKLTRAQVQAMLASEANTDKSATDLTVSSAGLTGVWAEENTRESIYAAFRRKETFATSGTRIRVRFFAGSYAANLLAQRDWTKSAYAKGVPMGGDWTGRTPSFLVHALKDPDGANLDRIQVVKVWLDGKTQKERVFDVAWAGQRRVDVRTGKLAAIGNSVDLKTGRTANRIGAVELKTLWRDPNYRAGQKAVYYARVLEIPTARWSTLRALEQGLPLPKQTALTIQERAWTSPIWVGGS